MSSVQSVPAPLRVAHRMSRMTASAVREILKVAERPDVLSFAGGLPAPELFPLQEIAAAHSRVFASDGAAALQYSTTEGFLPLREWICARLVARGIRATPEQVLITCGAQQGLDLGAKILIDAGDAVAIENPSYLAALQTFGGYEATMMVVDSDQDGLCVEALEAQLETRVPKLVYVVPDFHNPTGRTLSLARRHRLVELAQRHRFAIIEDDPYGELRFRAARLPSLAALDDQGLVLHLGTFSKTLAPGLRIGWIFGPRALVQSLTVARQAADLHSATLAQRAVAELLKTFDYEGHLATLRQAYGTRCDTMLAALQRELPAGTRWTTPDGGLFTWVELPQGLDGEQLLAEAVQEKVAFVPGSAFFAEAPRKNFIRLNFSNRSPDHIVEGIGRLGQVVRRQLG